MLLPTFYIYLLSTQQSLNPLTYEFLNNHKFRHPKYPKYFGFQNTKLTQNLHSAPAILQKYEFSISPNPNIYCLKNPQSSLCQSNLNVHSPLLTMPPLFTHLTLLNTAFNQNFNINSEISLENQEITTKTEYTNHTKPFHVTSYK